MHGNIQQKKIAAERKDQARIDPIKQRVANFKLRVKNGTRQEVHECHYQRINQLNCGKSQEALPLAQTKHNYRRPNQTGDDLYGINQFKSL